jgi:hypothetical protein
MTPIEFRVIIRSKVRVTMIFAMKIVVFGALLKFHLAHSVKTS